MPTQPARRGHRPGRVLTEVSLMLAGGLVGHAATAVVTGHVLGAGNSGVHGFRPGAALVGVVLALVVLGRHHMAERRSSHVMRFRVVVGQQAVLAAILALEGMTAGRVDQLAHDPWLWMGAVLQLALVGGWRLLERVAMVMADGLRGVPAVHGCEVGPGSSMAPRGRVARGRATGQSTRAPPASALLLGSTG